MPLPPPPSSAPCPSAARLLLVEPDPDHRLALAAGLRKLGHQVLATDDNQAVAQAARAGCDLVLMNPCAPRGAHAQPDAAATADLWWHLRGLRRQDPRLPVIVLHPGADSADRTLALELGADAVLDRLDDWRELRARVQTLLRRRREDTRPLQALPEPVRLVGWELDSHGRRVRPPGAEPVALSTAEYRLMRLFLRQPGCILSRSRLLDEALQADARQSDRSIDVLVSRLRRRLGDGRTTPQRIHTVRGAGYRFDPQPTAHMSKAQPARHADLTTGIHHANTGIGPGPAAQPMPAGGQPTTALG